MPERKIRAVKATQATGRRTPLVPTQERSRERFDRILAAATEILAEKGSDAIRMSDIVERTGIAFGSLYQYFPDKSAVIGTLAERCNATGHECVARDLAEMKKLSDLHAALCRITDGYYQMFRDHPVMHHIWQATQSDRTLQRIDQEDVAFLAGLLRDALHRVAPKQPAPALTTFSQLAMIEIGAAVRFAIALPPLEARRALDLFKRMLPKDLSALA
ncbi:TetR family transcriptional regulator [Bradyrhizobium sp. GCM10027634]|uniref:TetR/AcrR family transcriptional regulator n=1 Tax=unclassified Bradyrhizobium TaxID=2631580 RepID=UPI00188D483A|nr:MULTISPECIES: TetR/AcrR family transcriptional regulator [unclassified Bradyrhizobium]MDN5006465.1 TetR/AcrR family transcriptional regulator [Bradyrhizobium sp. WYCCWR 12677]QOZ44810.1 TetR/AcrR family transcriptional regulator [Bradyrhizobium sp. CCBAU 53340]